MIAMLNRVKVSLHSNYYASLTIKIAFSSCKFLIKLIYKSLTYI